MTQEFKEMLPDFYASFLYSGSTLFLVHQNPFGLQPGGVERVVKKKLEQAKINGLTVAVLSPEGQNLRFSYLYQGQVRTQVLHGFNFAALGVFETLELHHFLYWPHSSLSEITQLPFKHKLFFVHDFYAVCPSINLVHGWKKTFCALAASEASCWSCYKACYKMHFADLPSYQDQTRQLLREFDEILFPSSFSQELFLKIFPELASRSAIKSLDLSDLSISGSLDIFASKKVIFLGAFSNLKGAKPFRKAAARLEKIGFQPEIWGYLLPGEKAVSIPIRPYENGDQLKARFQNERPSCVIFPAITGETFSLTFHETVLFSAAIPVVAPWGHPTDVVKKSGYGIVLESSDSDHIVSAVLNVEKARVNLLSNRQRCLDIISGAQLNRANTGSSSLRETTLLTNRKDLSFIWAAPQFSHRLRRYLKFIFLSCLFRVKTP